MGPIYHQSWHLFLRNMFSATATLSLFQLQLLMVEPKAFGGSVYKHAPFKLLGTLFLTYPHKTKMTGKLCQGKL